MIHISKIVPDVFNSLEAWHEMEADDTEREHVKIVLPIPPSANRMWRSVVVRGAVRVLVSAEGRAWKERAELAVIAQCRQKLDDDVEVSIVAFMPNRRGDVDNLIKPALDVMQGSAYGNDRQITKLIVEKRYDKFSPRLEVEVRAA